MARNKQIDWVAYWQEAWQNRMRCSGPAWLLQCAQENYKALAGSFDCYAERYKYCPHAEVLPQVAELPGTMWEEVNFSAILANLPSEAPEPHLICANGRWHVTPRFTQWQGGAAHAFDALTSAQATALQQQFASFTPHVDPWYVLNTMLHTQGLWVELSTHVQPKEPLVIYRTTAPFLVPTGGASYSRLHLTIAPQAQATVIELVEPRHAAALTYYNHVTAIALAKGAHCKHYLLQLRSATPQVLWSHVGVTQAAQSVYHSYNFMQGADWVRHNFEISLDEPQAEAHLQGVYSPIGHHKVDNFTRIDHRAPHTHSDEHYKGTVAEQAQAVFNGQIHVQREAQQTQAFQQNDNLVLGTHARAYTKPQLEIWADDVKCSHGATVGQLDAQQLFYLQSRGIPFAQAKRLLTQAFLREVLQRFDTPVLHLLMRTLGAEQE